MKKYQIIDHPPKVFVAGISTPSPKPIIDYLKHQEESWRTPDTLESESIIEIAGRICYRSFSNPANRTRAEYMANIVNHNHLSTFEHLWANLLIADISRDTQLELVRHGEGTGFSFESTRFTDKALRFVMHPSLRDSVFGSESFVRSCDRWVEDYEEALNDLKLTYSDLYPDDKTLAKKRATEGARTLLPGCRGSDGMVSLNARAARHIIALRSDEHADQAIRELAYGIYQALKPHWPNVFADAVETPAKEGGPQITFTNHQT